ncbi:hypothetical protein GCM10007421_16810 [Halopseudomonas oceani]|uniref:GmrSD restriction endonucleases N-terminal domain-containing protein n=1 Tax=Halopseudomonas oceani TaxID=1708783 RepID=A0A2P4ESP8_9GAMM|nr:DUF262 domain-containing protein [Halopseudomonas oceani]POB02048.1 hypothetical protein C1949_14465 [Halopseudomonas oceani]GGE43231.1 hypothetical protein GCM10007421_16810 [Halopseudomonas oceani]
MAGRFERAITIRQAIRNIDDRTFLLPAIQRNFVWSTQQICTLFDSLMRDYPINTFMFWDVTSPEIKDKYRFYSFLTDYCQRFKESNDYVATKGDFKDFKAVIDGQQRLTSIYIGLKGTYAYKQPRVWWPNTRNDQALPPRRLYLNLRKGVDGDDNEAMVHYDFRFLTEKQVAAYQSDATSYWFEVGKVLSLPEVKSDDQILLEVVLPYLEQEGLAGDSFAIKALNRLYYLVRRAEVIHFYNEESQDIDYVLDVFIRTNSGGTPLAFSDLLMSIAIANWEGDARKDIDELIAEVRQSSEMQFSIGRDWVLKTCLMLTDADVRFKVKNFDADRVSIIQSQWKQIRSCIVATFTLLRRLGFNDHSLRAKNAVIPLAFYLYKQSFKDQPLYLSITNLNHLRDERLALSRWLHMVLLRGIFGGQADGVLSRMQRLLTRHLEKKTFPLEEIIEAFTGTNKDMRFDEAYLRGLLDIQYGDPRCRSVLSLLFPEINENLQLDIDHLHPKSAFTKVSLSGHAFLKEDADLMAFYRNPLNWNSIANLHLLNASQNRSKNDMALDEWISNKGTGVTQADLLLDDSASLDFKDFFRFYGARREALLQRLRHNVVVSDALATPEEALLDDEEEAEVET